VPSSTSKIRNLVLSKKALVGAGVIALVATGGATFGSQAFANDVRLSVDGEQTQVSSHADTVGDVLAEEGIEIGPHDVLAPSASTPVEDGSAISVQYGRQLTLEVDGKERTYWVTSRSVDRALDEVGRSIPKQADLSTSRSAAIGRQGLSVEVVTPKTVTVALAGKKPVKRTITALTVREALKGLKVDLEPSDVVTPKRPTALKDGMNVVYTDMATKKVTVGSEPISFETVEREDASMYEDEDEVVREGKDGARKVVYRVLFRNGEAIKRVELSSSVVRKPVAEIVKVGTKERPEPPVATGSAPGGVWGALAQCESGGNPAAVNPAGPYYGLYQFTASTWASVGGSGLPNQASAAEQTKRAQILQARSGWGQWPACAAELGLL